MQHDSSSWQSPISFERLVRSSRTHSFASAGPGQSGVRIKSTDELEAVWGDRIRHLGQDHPTAYLLCQALRKLQPPVLVSDAIAGRWLRVHCGINVRSKVENDF